MKALRTFLKTVIVLIYAVLALIVLYFPVSELIAYMGRETRLFHVRIFVPTEDALLPAFALAVLYAFVTALLRRVERKQTVQKDV